jgi:hypothetical protein
VQGDQSITRDVVTIIRRYRLLGFNAIRVPFSMTSLFKTAPRNFYGACQATSDASLRAATTRPGISTPGEACSTCLLGFVRSHARPSPLHRTGGQAQLPSTPCVHCLRQTLPVWHLS